MTIPPCSCSAPIRSASGKTRAGGALGQLAIRYQADRFITAAVLSSVTPENIRDVMAAVLDVEPPREPPAETLEQLVALATPTTTIARWPLRSCASVRLATASSRSGS